MKWPLPIYQYIDKAAVKKSAEYFDGPEYYNLIPNAATKSVHLCIYCGIFVFSVTGILGKRYTESQRLYAYAPSKLSSKHSPVR